VVGGWFGFVVVVWGGGDQLFPMAHAHRLADAFPQAELQTIEDSSTYVMLDQPDQTATAIQKFVGP
jgi:pimeloyl-ACP methyl ester carboxylesterase